VAYNEGVSLLRYQTFLENNDEANNYDVGVDGLDFGGRMRGQRGRLLQDEGRRSM
jgi:hypothetical protein